MLKVTKRTKSLLKGGTIVVVLGVGLRIYMDVTGPQAYLLRLTLTKEGVSSEKTLELPLQVIGRPAVSERPLEGPRCKWVLESFMHRTSSAEPWRDFPSSDGKYSLLQGSGVHARLWFSRAPVGEWKARVRAEVEYWDGETKDTWKGATTQEFVTTFSAADLKRIAARQAEAERLNQIELAKPPKGAVVLIKGKKYISKMQCSFDSGQQWRDVPSPGTPGYPLVANQGDVLGFRAVKANPKEEWPDYPNFLPSWRQNHDANDSIGDSVYLQFALDHKGGELQTVTVHCGNQLSTVVRVLPKGDDDLLCISDKTDLAFGESGRFNQARLTVRADDSNPAFKNARVRFNAYYEDGSKADLINAPGAQDDILTLDKDSIGFATIRAGRKTGIVHLTAQLVDSQGKLLFTEPEKLKFNVHAGWWAREQEEG